MWLAKLTASALEDEKTIDHPFLRLSGFGLYKRSVNTSFYYLLGGAYTFTFGRGIPFPVIGAGWRFTNGASLTTILPLNVNYRFGKKTEQYSVFIRPNGGLSKFYNSGIYPAAPETIIFRKREFALGVNKKFRLTDKLSIQGEAGVLFGRRLYFSRDFTRESSATIFKSHVNNGPYFSLGLKYKFKMNNPVVGNDPSDWDYF
jgi:hypothetical protein